MRNIPIYLAALVFALSCVNQSFAETDVYSGPVFDVHLHAGTADQNRVAGISVCPHLLEKLPPPDPQIPWPKMFMEFSMNPTCEDAIKGSMTDQQVLLDTIDELKRNNAVGIISGSPGMVQEWMKTEPNRFLPSIQLNLERDPYGPDDVKRLIKDDGFMMIGEISNQYVGIPPNDPRMDAFYAVAQELDVPVAIHMGGGPPGTAAMFPNYRISHGDPALLEPVLAKFPMLRISIMHMAEGYTDKVKMLLYAYPNVYLDIGGHSWMKTRKELKKTLVDLIDSGWGGRIMFGSDQMNWPGIITPAIDVIRTADYLTLEQKEAILWSNAIRFLKLDDKKARGTAMGQ